MNVPFSFIKLHQRPPCKQNHQHLMTFSRESQPTFTNNVSAAAGQMFSNLCFLLLPTLEADRSLQVDSLMLVQIYRIAAVSVQGRMSSHCTHSSSQCTDHRVSLHPEISDENAQFWVHD